MYLLTSNSNAWIQHQWMQIIETCWFVRERSWNKYKLNFYLRLWARTPRSKHRADHMVEGQCILMKLNWLAELVTSADQEMFFVILTRKTLVTLTAFPNRLRASPVLMCVSFSFPELKLFRPGHWFTKLHGEHFCHNEVEFHTGVWKSEFHTWAYPRLELSHWLIWPLGLSLKSVFPTCELPLPRDFWWRLIYYS